jgi:capsular polysaccharide biosynthesis protein
MTVHEYLQVLNRNRWLIAVCTVMPVLLAGSLSLLSTPFYTASATSLVSISSGQRPSELTQGALYVEAQMESYADLATTQAALQPVINDLELNTTPQALATRISVSVQGDTSMIKVSVTDSSPSRRRRSRML